MTDFIFGLRRQIKIGSRTDLRHEQEHSQENADPRKSGSF